MHKMFESRNYFRPFDYDFAYEYFKQSEQSHWFTTEVPLNEDVKDFKTKLTISERNLIENILKFFTKSDTDISDGYVDYYLPIFKNPEIRLAMTSIAARESVHQDAYSALVEELALGEDTYKVFTEYKEMLDKHEYLFKEGCKAGNLNNLCRNIARISVFGEGLQLFGSFAILLSFQRFGLMKGMGQIVSWSIRDETLHAEFMIKIFNILREHVTEKEIRDICLDMVELEDRFIDLCFDNFTIRGLDKGDVKKYIRFVAGVRMKQIGYEDPYGLLRNPLPWVDEIVFGKEHVNFFETKATDYSKGAIEGSWEDAF